VCQVLAYQSIGVLSPFVEADYFSLLLSGIREVLRPHHFQLLAFQGTPADLRTTRLAHARVAGWIVIVETEHIQDVAPSGTPLVTVAAIAPDQACSAVLTDNYGGMYKAIEHLYTHGHQRIAFVGPQDQLDFQQRYAGYQAALSAYHLPLDTDLVYFVDNEEEPGGRQAAQRMLAAGLPCTAVATATDEIAIGLMEELQAAGKRIPADVAIVGFDDIDRAQYTTPALTTIRQHPEELGRTAAELIMRQIAADAPMVDVTYIPTTLILRRSCGCAGAVRKATLDAAVYQIPGWQEALTQQLVRLVCAPLRLEGATTLSAIWPGAASLTKGLAAALAAGPPLPATQIERAWHQAVALTADLESLDSIFQELDRAATRQLAARPADLAAHADTKAFLDSARRSLTLACLAQGRAQLYYIENSVKSNHTISMSLLGAEMTTASSLAWLAETGVTGGCLSLWAESPLGESATLILAGHYDRAGHLSPPCASRYGAALYPPDEILPPSAHADGPDSVLVLPVRTASCEWGLLTICAPFAEQFAVENIVIWANLLGVALERTAFLSSLTAQQATLREQQETLRAAYERERELVESIRVSEERYALAAHATNDGLWDWDLTTDTIYYSARWKAMLGYSDDAIGTSPEAWLSRVHPEDRPGLERAIADHRHGLTSTLEYEHRMRDCGGTYRWMHCRGLAVHDSTPGTIRMVGSLTDMTVRKQLEQRLRHDALYDGLTGLPNRSLFLDRLERVIAHAKRNPEYLCAVLFLDLDGFKIVNDSLGHLVGDQLLIGVARRLTTYLRADDTAARFGGDEFAVLLNDFHDMATLPELIDRIQTHLAEPFLLDGHEVVVTASIGIAINLTDYQHVADVLRDADIAMYRAKAAGKRTYAIFDTEMHAGAVNRLQLESELRRAIAQQEFEIHYQPIVELATGRIVHVETLIRWRHPERGLLAPAAFLPIAEETGLIVPIGHWFFAETCRQIRAWQSAAPAQTAMPVSVNVSHKQFWHPGLIEAITSALRASGLDPCVLHVEITEGVIMSNPAAANKILHQLHDQGMQLHIDDFGTGYSSLEALHRFPIDALKIDRAFIAELGDDRRSTELVRTMIMMGQNLGLNVIAEGVETIEQQRSLQALNCRYGQGYLFARPMPGRDVYAWLQSGRAMHPAPIS
jgi:diguanylate cyclase (GGDEF)-like protein/PAS domain S-box-containing protein